MRADIPPHIQSLKRMKDQAEDVEARAKTLADALRADYAANLLHDAFPDYALAIFARRWDEDEPALLQLLSAEADKPDLELGNDERSFIDLPEDKKSIVIEAERSVIRIGSDQDILDHLDPGDTEHDDWYEFVMHLDPHREGRVL